MTTLDLRTATGRSTVSAPFAAAGVLYLALVCYVTLGPVPWAAATNEAPGGVLSPATWLDPVTWTSGGPFEFVANIAMFVPIGVLLRLAFRRLRAGAAVGVAVLITVAIEVVQIPLDRVSDPRDLVANSLGSVLGMLLTLGRGTTSPDGARAVPTGPRRSGRSRRS